MVVAGVVVTVVPGVVVTVVPGVVVTVVPGVVVTVVAVQHVVASQRPVGHTISIVIGFMPSGQVNPAQVGRGVVVTVVTTGAGVGTGTGAAVVQGDDGAGVGTGTGAGATVSHGLPDTAWTVTSKAKENTLLPAMATST